MSLLRYLSVSAIGLSLTLSGCKQNITPTSGYIFPAEFEKHSAIWMAWGTYDNKRGHSVHAVQSRIIAALHGHSPVKLIVQDKNDELQARTFLKQSGITLQNLTFLHIPHNDVWVRDMGPIFTVDRQSKRMRLVDFNFNTWGYEKPTSAYSKRDEAVDSKLAKILRINEISTPMISEGGNREFNGLGTMIASEVVERQRNPGMTKTQMEQVFRQTLGVKKVIWLQKGVVEDDMTTDGPLPGGYYTVVTTGGHVDEYVRFADRKTILLAEITKEEIAKQSDSGLRSIMKETQARLQGNLKILQAARDVDGQPFKIVRIPAPILMTSTMAKGDGVFDYLSTLRFQKGGIRANQPIKVVMASSYLNFLVTNGLVLMQTYALPGMPAWAKANEARAKATLQKVFPGRRVVLIDATAVNWGGGGIHCITQQQPAI